jgi:hypothetical protein
MSEVQSGQHDLDWSKSSAAMNGAQNGTPHKRTNASIANGAEDSGNGEVHSLGASAARRQENGGHVAVGGARPRPLDPRALSLWQRYVLANKTHPLRTKCLTTGPFISPLLDVHWKTMWHAGIAAVSMWHEN